MSVVKKYESYLFSSDPNSGALNVSADGSRFFIQLDRPIEVPRTAIDAELRVLESKIWNVNPNIGPDLDEGANNVLNFSVNARVNATSYEIVIPEGLYTLENLNSSIGRELVNLDLDRTAIQITGDDATQKIIFTFGIDGVQLDFTAPNGLNGILGVDSRLLPVAPSTVGQIEFGDNIAQFNRTQSHLIATDLISNGVPINSTSGSGIISVSPITVRPGYQNVYEPYNPIIIDASELIGQSKSSWSFRLTDQLLRPINTRSEFYSLTIEISYTIASNVVSLKDEYLNRGQSGSGGRLCINR